MKIASIILACVGGLLALFIGIKWIGDYSNFKDQIVAAEKLVQTTGKEMPAEFQEVKKLRTASFLLLIFGVIGIASGFLMGKLGKKVTGAIMIASAVIPAIWATQSLIFTFFLIIGGILAFLTKPKSVGQAA